MSILNSISTDEYLEMVEELEAVFNKHNLTMGLAVPYYPECKEDEGIVMQIFVEETKNDTV